MDESSLFPHHTTGWQANEHSREVVVTLHPRRYFGGQVWSLVRNPAKQPPMG